MTVEEQVRMVGGSRDLRREVPNLVGAAKLAHDAKRAESSRILNDMAELLSERLQLLEQHREISAAAASWRISQLNGHLGYLLTRWDNLPQYHRFEVYFDRNKQLRFPYGVAYTEREARESVIQHLRNIGVNPDVERLEALDSSEFWDEMIGFGL